MTPAKDCAVGSDRGSVSLDDGFDEAEEAITAATIAYRVGGLFIGATSDVDVVEPLGADDETVDATFEEDDVDEAFDGTGKTCTASFDEDDSDGPFEGVEEPFGSKFDEDDANEPFGADDETVGAISEEDDVDEAFHGTGKTFTASFDGFDRPFDGVDEPFGNGFDEDSADEPFGGSDAPVSPTTEVADSEGTDGGASKDDGVGEFLEGTDDLVSATSDEDVVELFGSDSTAASVASNNDGLSTAGEDICSDH